MDYNDINTYFYYIKPYGYGWMVYHIEEGKLVMDMCFSYEDDAKSYALTLNTQEAKRVADAKVRLENAKKSLVLPASHYYSITGYYGD